MKCFCGRTIVRPRRKGGMYTTNDTRCTEWHPDGTIVVICRCGRKTLSEFNNGRLVRVDYAERLRRKLL